MRADLRRSLAAVLLLSVLSASARATQSMGRAPSLKPLVEIIRTNPALREEFVLQASIISQMAPAALAQAILALPPASPLGNVTIQSEVSRLAIGLVAQPELVLAGQAELAGLLGEQNALTFHQAARSVSGAAAAQPSSELAVKLQRIREQTDLVHAGSLLALNERISGLVDGAGVRPAASPAPEPVLVGESRREASVLLQPSGGMDAAALQAYLAAPGRAYISPRGMKRANFDSGDYRPGYDAYLKAQGYDVVVVRNPSRREVESHGEEQGFHLKPETVRWVIPASPLEQHLESLGKGPGNKLRKEIERSSHLTIERGPLTPEAFEEWYPIYEDEVVGKPGGKRNVPRDFARKILEKQGNLDTWHGVFYRDPATGRMVGGVIMKEWRERGMFVLGYAAYRPETKPLYMSVRTFAEGMKLAASLGYPVLSLGQDTNLFGYDYNLGLMQNKVRFHMTPYPEEPLVLLKVLDNAKFLADRDHNGQQAGYFFFGIKRDSAVARRYLEARDAAPDAQAPEPWELLGSPFYFTPETAPAPETTVGLHFYKDDVKISSPKGIDVVRRPVAADAVPQPPGR